jgi:dipeptidyl aminopeptidase/acylaminoacyl peptidase
VSVGVGQQTRLWRKAMRMITTISVFVLLVVIAQGTFAASRERAGKAKQSSKIAFRSNRDGNWEIYVMNSDGSEHRRLTHNVAPDDQPRFSPDGMKIIFRSKRDGNQEIYIISSF